MRVVRRHDPGILVALAALPFVWYARPIFTDAGHYLGDLTAQYNPWWTFAHESLRAGRLPLWNPYTLGGMPYHVNPENSLFYPLKLPLFALSFFKAAAVLRACNAAVSSCGMYLLLRSLGLRAVPGISGALMFSYGSFMAYKFVHIPYVNTAVWLPWQLLLVQRLARRPRLSTTLWLALVTAASFLGGSPGIFFVCQLTLGCFTLFEALRLGASRRRARLGRLALCLVAAAVLFCGLGLVLLAPAWEFVAHTPRAGGLATSTTWTDFALTGRALEAMAFPYAHYGLGAPYPPLYPVFFLNVPYVGGGAVLLALLGLGSRRHRSLLPFAATAVTFGTLASAGTHTALLPRLIENVPGFAWFRWPHDYALMVYVVLSILAAAGLDRVLRAPPRARGRLALWAALYLGAGLLWLRSHVAAVALVTGSGVIVGALLLSRVCAARPPLRWLPAALILGTLSGDLLLFGSGYRVWASPDRLDLAGRPAIDFVRRHAGFDRVAVAAPSPGIRFLQQERIFPRHLPLFERTPGAHAPLADLDSWLRRQDPTGWTEQLWARRERFHNIHELFSGFPVNASMALGYQEVSGYDPFRFDRVGRMYGALAQTRSWDLMGVRWVVTAQRVDHPRLEPAFEGGGLYVWENAGRFPRVAIPRLVETGLDGEGVLERLGAPGFDPRRTALFEEDLPPHRRERTEPAPASGGETAMLVDHRPEVVTVDARLTRPGFLVLHDVFHPGWKAFVGERELEVRRVNFTFRAVHLPAGSHRVVFVYRPDGLAVRAAISASLWLVCLGAAATMAVRARVSRPRARRWEHAEIPGL